MSVSLDYHAVVLHLGLGRVEMGWGEPYKKTVITFEVSEQVFSVLTSVSASRE